jgi:hypothetical protein
MRNTKNPYVGDGFLDLSLIGELIHGNHYCNLKADPLDFDEDNKVFSQIVVSEDLASCVLENFSLSPIGKVKLDTKRANQLFGRNDLAIDTSYLASKLYMTAFKEMVGPNEDLEIILQILKPTINFKTNPNVIAHFLLGFDVYHIKGSKRDHLMYDEIKMLVTFDAKGHAESDIVDLYFQTMKLDISNKYGQKSQPVKNPKHMSESEYKDFLISFSLTANTLKQWLNDVVLIDGIHFPYQLDEFKTDLTFLEK